MTNKTGTPAQLLASLLLGEPVAEWILRRRYEGATWKIIARGIYEKTDGQLDVTERTCKLWAGVS